MSRTTSERKSRYRVKKELGLVPHVYDKNSRSFSEGAWRHWPHRRDKDKKITFTCPVEERSNLDGKFLSEARENR